MPSKPFNDKEHNSCKDKAKDAIKNGDLSALQKCFEETYQVAETRTRYVPNPGGSYELGTDYDVSEDYWVDVDVSYLSNERDQKELLQVAIQFQKNEIIHFFLKQGVRFTQDQIDTFANNNNRQERYNMIEPLFAHLNTLSSKASELRERGSFESPRKIQSLVNNIHKEITNFVVGEKPITLETFKQNCTRYISKAKPTLEGHRGLKSILANLLITVGTLGLANVARFAVTRGQHTFFHFETDSGKKLKSVEREVKEIQQVEKNKVAW